MFGIDATGLEQMTATEEVAERLYADAEAVLQKREKEVGDLLFLRVFRNFFLQEIDNQWLEHLQSMDSLRDGIGLRGYGQRDPKKEYQKEGFNLFLELMQNIKASVVGKMYHFVIEREDEIERLEAERRERLEARQQRMQASHAAAGTSGAEAAGPAKAGAQPQPGQPGQAPAVASRRQRRRAAAMGREVPDAAQPEQPATVKRDRPKVGRNDPCWCGSGKKYKACHLRSDEAQPGA
jgi:preprotein translocase subunit SecA